MYKKGDRVDYREEIIKLLNEYIDRNWKLKKSYEDNVVKRDLYIGLLPLINSNFDTIMDNRLSISILLNSIYDNNTYSDFYETLLEKATNGNEKQLRDFVTSINQDFNKVNSEIEKQLNEINKNRNMVSSAKRVKLSLRRNTPIIDGKYDVMRVMRIFDCFEKEGKISNKEELLFINYIEYYNRRLLSSSNSKKEMEYSESLYQRVPNIVNAGYETYPEIEISRNRKIILDDFVKQISDAVDLLELDQIIDFISGYRNHQLSDEEYEYIIINILNKYIEDMIDWYSLIINKETYSHRHERLDVVGEYYRCLSRFLVIREYYDKFLEETNVVIEEEVDVEVKGNKKFIFASNEIKKAKIVSDMKNIPFEYYNRVWDLISRFKSGESLPGEVKFLHNNKNYSGLMELREDQVRIVLRHVRDDIYFISGVFVKKKDNDINMYNVMARRNIPDISTQEKFKNEELIAEKAINELKDLVENKGRTSSR